MSHRGPLTLVNLDLTVNIKPAVVDPDALYDRLKAMCLGRQVNEALQRDISEGYNF